MATKQILKFNVEHIILIRNQFKLVDSNGDGFINEDEFRKLFRSFGQTISEKRLDWIISDIFSASDDKPGVDFDTFVSALINHYSPPPTEKVVREAFQLLDENSTGYIDKSKLTEVLTTRGEKLTLQEVEYFNKIMGIEQNNNEIDYATLAEDICKVLSQVQV